MREVDDEHRSVRPGASAPAVDRIELTPDTLVVAFADGTAAQFNRFWLRDNCPANGDRSSLFRPFSVAEMPDDLRLLGADASIGGDSVVVQFSDGLQDRFPATFLHDHAGGEFRRPPAARSRPDPDHFDLAELVEWGARHHALLEAVATAGFAVVEGVDPDDGTEALAALLGPIRETDFGRIFDIVTEPSPFTPSQSECALDPHTDDPYRYSPAGISILQCVTPCDGMGGTTMVVDGFAIAEMLAGDDPEAYELLATIPVTYEHRRADAVAQGDAVHLRADAPVIARDAAGAVCGVRFHERSMAPLRLPPELTEAYYRALMRFARAVHGGEFTYRRQLSAGEALVYDNQRVLHGRTAIEGGGRRHLRLCTVDRDQVHSRLRLMRSTFAPGSESWPLPAGNLS